MKKLLLLLSLFLTISISVHSQDTIKVSKHIDNLSFGIGMGLDLGGFGGSLLYYPHKNIGVFAGVGYALIGVGYNAGVKLRLLSKKPTSRVNPYFLLMYGYYASIKVKNSTDLNKMFYGPTFGVGLDYKPKFKGIGYWSFALLIPIRAPEVDDYIEYLRNKKRVSFDHELLPFGVSIGYRFIINYKAYDKDVLKKNK